ncbi:MAG: ParB/RepB/Spo0J family partition protein [Bacillota bacterium]|nr:ParB/RepB/Spo0J family partition protein [Bacillota bacterium]
MKKPALGRGLDALFPQVSQEGEVLNLDIGLLDPNPDQPRKDFDEDALNELSESIKNLGLLQPILAYPENGRYRIIAGERRFRAAMKAGLTQVPVLVRTLPQHQVVLAALMENLQREDLNAMEAALAVRQLMDEGNFTQEEAAKQLGKSRPAVANLLRLLQLTPQVQQMVRDNLLTEGHARVLAGIPQKMRQLELAQKTVARNLSVRELEALSKQEKKKTKSGEQQQFPELMDFQEKLLEAVGVKAQIKGSLQKGRIVLPYRSYEELEGIYEAISRLLD